MSHKFCQPIDTSHYLQNNNNSLKNNVMIYILEQKALIIFIKNEFFHYFREKPRILKKNLEMTNASNYIFSDRF